MNLAPYALAATVLAVAAAAPARAADIPALVSYGGLETGQFFRLGDGRWVENNAKMPPEGRLWTETPTGDPQRIRLTDGAAIIELDLKAAQVKFTMPGRQGYPTPTLLYTITGVALQAPPPAVASAAPAAPMPAAPVMATFLECKFDSQSIAVIYQILPDSWRYWNRKEGRMALVPCKMSDWQVACTISASNAQYTWSLEGREPAERDFDGHYVGNLLTIDRQTGVITDYMLETTTAWGGAETILQKDKQYGVCKKTTDPTSTPPAL